MRARIVIAALGALGAVAGACGGDEDTGMSSCEAAVRAAAESESMTHLFQVLDPAIATCESLDDLIAATEQYPDALDGNDAGALVADRCARSDDPTVTGSSICSDLGG